MSMVKSVELLLKMEVSDDIRAAIITAIISPRKPVIHTQMDRSMQALQKLNRADDTLRSNIFKAI